jgi:hypothetical protein
VLREALAAQSRRRTLNAALLGLLAATTVLAFPLGRRVARVRPHLATVLDERVTTDIQL